MSSSQYHPTPIPGSPPPDSESEDDLDLQELDPATTSLKHTEQDLNTSQGGRSQPGRGAGIALRNLRGAGRGRLWRRDEGHNNSEAEEDMTGLLQDDDAPGQRDSQGSYGNGEADAPLLRSGWRRGRRHREDGGRLSHLGSRIRLPSFMSTNSQPEALPEEPPEDDAETDPGASRQVLVGQTQRSRFPANVVSNAKYTPWSFLPRTLYNEFSFFINMYFLLVALSQIIPFLRIGYMSTYIAPLAVVLSITLGKEALDDIARRRRDGEANAEGYTVLSFRDANSGVGRRAGRATRSQNRDTRSTNGHVQTGPDGDVSVQEVIKKSRDLKVGDILKIRKDRRLPADVILLKSMSNDASAKGEDEISSDLPPQTEANLLGSPTDVTASALTSQNQQIPQASESPPEQYGESGESFIRTDQLDGETDWKLRLPSPLTQSLDVRELRRLKITAGAPDKKVNEFVGTVELSPSNKPYDPYIGNGENQTPARNGNGHVSVPESETKSAPLTIDNTAWANTVLASNTTTYAVVVYTGVQTRSALSTSASRSKSGLLEHEINNLTKILCILTLALSIVLVALEGFEPSDKKKWYVAIMIYLILFSTIVPVSLRVNLDLGKTVYASFIERDKGIPGTVVRTSTIPEDLGRIEYLLSDKTGTLTQNEMELKKIHVGTVSYANEAMDEVASYIRHGFLIPTSNNAASSLVTPSSVFATQATAGTATRTRREIGSRVRDVILALALCHNVTPTVEEEDGKKITTYQASSPDEIAIVQYTENVGLKLVHRDRQSIVLQSADSGRVVVRVRILDIFPFTSDSKRMGIIVQFDQGTDSSSQQVPEIWFYQKGADTVMTSIVAANDWLDEETANMAREGLRTLVVGRKRLSTQQYQDFSQNYKQASLTILGREAGMAKVIKDYLERDLELLGVTGVEDKLQKDVKPSLELLRNAGVKIWMLTGDKVETARCVAISAKLVARGQYVHTITKLNRKDHAQDALDFLRNKTDACLLIDGESLSYLLSPTFQTPFIAFAVLLPTVIACRCSPTQKAQIALLIRKYTKKRIACIGDGGNDVSMIQAADVGIGIVGKEGRQASLAADFSITQFHHITKLLVWHGRNSYKRSAKLAQFIMHRGLIIAVCQTLYSIAGHFDPKGLFIDWLLVGYATIYTSAPVFSLVLDKDVDEHLANLYPELYRELKTGRSLSYRSFFVWVAVSIYQGSIIQGLSQLLVGSVDGPRMVSVSFTTLVLNELIMVAFEIKTWHPIMIICLLGTAAVYFGSIPFLGRYFDLGYIITWGFVWRVAAIGALSLVPVYVIKVTRRMVKPPSYRKVRGT
jgi:phospholipid-translocating ATPase